MIKAIIFDCFGVLVGTGFWNVYQALGGDLARDAAFIDQNLKGADTGRLSQPELRRIMSDHLGVSLEDYTAAYDHDEVPNLELFAFIRSQLRSVYKLGIVSNAGPGVIEQRIPPGLRQLFDVVVTSGDSGLLKPDPAIYRLAAARLGVPLEQIVFIDDHVQYLPGAQAVGMQTILYKDFDDFKKQLAGLLT